MTSITADILISGGLLVSGSSITKMDVAVTGEKIIDVSAHPSDIQAKRIIDATGLYVLPGLIDAHNHPINLDKMDSFTLSAAFGGITTVIPFMRVGEINLSRLIHTDSDFGV